MEKNINIQQALFFSFLKKAKPIKQKKKKKMRLLLFFILSRYGLAHKYRIIPKISIYNWICRIAFSDISGIAFFTFSHSLLLLINESIRKNILP